MDPSYSSSSSTSNPFAFQVFPVSSSHPSDPSDSSTLTLQCVLFSAKNRFLSSDDEETVQKAWSAVPDTIVSADFSYNSFDRIPLVPSKRGRPFLDLVTMKIPVNVVRTLKDLDKTCPRLEVLDARQNHLKTVDGIWGLAESLREVDISFNDIPRLTPSWERMTRLTSLCISGNPISALEWLPEHLETLKCVGCLIKNIDGIVRCKDCLRSLDISNNEVDDSSAFWKSMFSLGKLELLHSIGNPVEKNARSFRTRLIRGIPTLRDWNGIVIDETLHEKVNVLAGKRELDDIVEELRNKHEKMLKEEDESTIRRIQQIHEDASHAEDMERRASHLFKQQLQNEFEDVVGSLKDAANSADSQSSASLSASQTAEWKRITEESERKRRAMFERRKAEKMQEHRRRQMEKNFFHKLYHVAMESPDTWRKLKEAELDQRQNEEEVRFQSKIAHQREASIERKHMEEEISKHKKIVRDGDVDSKDEMLTPSYVSILSYLLDEKMVADMQERIDRLDRLTLKIQKFFRQHLFRVRVKNLAERLRQEKQKEQGSDL